MSDELEKKIDKLEELVEKSLESQPTGPSFKLIGPIITVLILSAGIVGTWFTQKAALVEAKQDITKLEQTVERQETTIQDIKLKAVQESSDLKSVKEDVAEIKQDVKKLLSR